MFVCKTYIPGQKETQKHRNTELCGFFNSTPNEFNFCFYQHTNKKKYKIKNVI